MVSHIQNSLSLSLSLLVMGIESRGLCSLSTHYPQTALQDAFTIRMSITEKQNEVDSQEKVLDIPPWRNRRVAHQSFGV